MQSYQVFINDHLILLTEETNSSDQHINNQVSDFDSVIKFNDVDSDEIKLIVEWLFNEKEAVFKVVLPQANIDKIMQDFMQCYKVIEAAGGLVKNKAKELIMIYRLNKWDLPKGKIETGESSKSAAIREVEEECGINDLEILSDLPSTYHMYINNNEKLIKKTYWYDMIYQGNQKLIPQSEEGIEKVEWVNKENLDQKLTLTYASLRNLLISSN